MRSIPILLLLFILFSCADDVELNIDNSIVDDVEIAGRWNFTLFASENPYDLNDDGVANRDIITETGCYQEDYAIFNDDGTGQTFSFDYLETSTTITIPSGEYSFTIMCIEEEEITDFTWTQNGSTVTMIIDGSSFDWTLSGNKLTTLIPEGFIVLDEETFEVAITEDITQELTKD